MSECFTDTLLSRQRHYQKKKHPSGCPLFGLLLSRLKRGASPGYRDYNRPQRRTRSLDGLGVSRALWSDSSLVFLYIGRGEGFCQELAFGHVAKDLPEPKEAYKHQYSRPTIRDHVHALLYQSFFDKVYRKRGTYCGNYRYCSNPNFCCGSHFLYNSTWRRNVPTTKGLTLGAGAVMYV